MIGAISLAVLLQAKKPPQSRDFENSQVTVKFLREFQTGRAIATYGNDLSPYLFEQTFKTTSEPSENEPAETVPTTFTISKPEKGSWKFTAPADSTTMEVEADSSVVIPYQRMDYNGFTVLDVKTGAKLWSRKAAAKGNRTVMGLYGGVLYQWDAGHLTATNERSGDVIWDKPVEGRSSFIQFSPILVKNGRLYVNLEIEKKVTMVCVDARSGAEVWRREIGAPISIVNENSMPGFTVVGNKVVGYKFAKEREDDLQKQSVFCLEANTGTPIWEHRTPYTAWPFTPEANETSVFAGTMHRASFLYNIADGSQIAKLNLRWGMLVGSYVVDMDEQDGLTIYTTSGGERIGRIQLTQRTLWMPRTIKDRLILYRFGDDTRTTVLYEILPSK